MARHGSKGPGVADFCHKDAHTRINPANAGMSIYWGAWGFRAGESDGLGGQKVQCVGWRVRRNRREGSVTTEVYIPNSKGSEGEAGRTAESDGARAPHDEEDEDEDEDAC